jgi:peptide/nickel transport system permease protein
MAAKLSVWVGLMILAGFAAATLVRMAPGFGMDERLLDARLGAATREAIEERSGGRTPAVRYYGEYLSRLVRGDLGESLSCRRPVRELLGERLAVSARAGAIGLGLAWMTSLLAVVGLEWKKRRRADGVAAAAAGAMLCVPAAVVALGCVYAGAGAAIAIAVILLPRLFRYLRNLAAGACAAPHVVAAHAMGIPRWRLLWLHAGAPAAAELAALAGVSVSMMVGATIPAEALCDSPGVGQLLWQAALSRDLPVLLNVTLLITALTTGANLLAGAARRPGESDA